MDTNNTYDFEKIEFQLIPYSENNPYDLDAVLFRLDNQIDLLSSHADKWDYIVSIGSGIVSSMLDVFLCGDIDLVSGREIASEKVEGFVKKVAKMAGCENSGDLKQAVSFLEKKYQIPSDGNILDFGGGLQHHLRDFSHHPTIAGLVFSILTQFTGHSYGTDTDGNFIHPPVSEAGLAHIADNIPQKIMNGTIVWFFHLVSDMAGSTSTAGLSGGTGIPGPILSLAKELSTLPFFQNLNQDGTTMSTLISKMFNGTLWAKRGKDGNIIKESVVKFDLRGELGFEIELGRQALPVIINESIVRCFYFIRHLAIEMRGRKVSGLDDFQSIDWKNVLPMNNPTLSNMITVSTGVFTALDIGEAIVTQKYWVGVNYIGIGRFAVAIGEDVSWCLKKRNLKLLKKMYSEIDRNTYRRTENNIYRKMESDLGKVIEGFELTAEQTEILYNVEYHKTQHDIELDKSQPNKDRVRIFKMAWVIEWKKYMEEGYTSFLQVDDVQLHWYSYDELMQKISECDPEQLWFRFVLYEAMLFEPYYTIGLEQDKNGNYIPSKKYDFLNNSANGYRKGEGDQYLEQMFSSHYCEEGFIKQIRKSFEKNKKDLNERFKKIVKSISISAVVAAAVAATGGVLAPTIAVALVGSNFAGLSGAALTSACLAYLGGGAIAAGGAGMAGGTLTIVGGGAALGFGFSESVGGTVEATGKARKESIISQSAKLLVSVNEIFLNVGDNVDFANLIYQQYTDTILEAEHAIVEINLDKDVKKVRDRQELNEQIKDLEETVDVMKACRKIMHKYLASYSQ